ncbi:MAG: hypothetical protein EON58_13640, partial [Alphaproteobacteria bacterium]
MDNALIEKEVRNRLVSIVGSLKVTAESPNHVMKAYGALVAKNATIRLDERNARAKTELANEAAAIFAADIANNPLIMGMPMSKAIAAADFTDPNGSLGLLSGTLVMQQTLPLMLSHHPLLSSITTDFSAEVGQLNQTAVTRIVLKPPVQTYDPTQGTDSRPLGWKIASPSQTVDVPVTLSDYVGVPLVFGAGTLNATPRKLFDESVPLAVNALGEYATDKISALMTAANFNAYKGNSAASGVTTSGSPNITVTSTANMYPGQAISGTGIPDGTYILSVDSGTAATLTRKATASNSGLTFTLNGGRVPTNYSSYVKALNDWGVASLDEIAGAFDLNKLPMDGRFAALLPSYYRKLGSDAAINALMQATGDPTYLTERRLPKVSSFEMHNSAWMPQSGNRVGFAGHKGSFVLKTRLPADLASFLPVSQSASITITDPSSGLSMLLVQYADLKSNYVEWRPEMILGAAPGDRRCGMVITSTFPRTSHVDASV